MSTVHTIRSGETLSSIAQRYNTTVDKLARANNIQNPNLIHAGRQLTIPDGFDAQPRPSSGPQAGDGFDSGPSRPSAPGSIPTAASGQFNGTSAAPGTTNVNAWIPVDAPLQGDPANRNAETYADVIDQFAVGSNPRHAPRDGNTYCNIFAWDVTRAMGAEIPHWVDGAGNPVGVGEGRELDANGGHQWLQNNGPQHGWREVSAEEAQAMANAGHPTVASWHNPGGIGHIAVVRPGEITDRGPAIAQAGGSNFNEGHVRDGFGGAQPQYFVNDRGTATQGSPQPAPVDPANPSEPSQPAPQAARFTVPQNDLQRGMEGPEVEQLQTALVDLGYMTQAQMNTGPGIFGPQTEASLKRFQADHGVPNTGYYGPLTRAALTQKAGGTSGPGPVGPTPEPGGAGSVSQQQLQAIMPNLSDARAQEMLPHLNAAMQEAGINTPLRQAAFLAQLAHESGEFRWMEELASGADYEGREDLGNTEPGDGVRFKGRGPIQLTGRSNYRAASQALGIDLVNNPTRAADPDVGFRTAAWFWNSRDLNSAADARNFDHITYRVNGGYNGKASRDAYYARALQVLGA